MTQISTYSGSSGDWMSEFFNGDYAKSQLRKVEADYMSRLRQHVEEQKNRGTYTTVASAIDDFANRLNLTAFEKTALNGLAKFAQLNDLPDPLSKENLAKEMKEQGAPASILPGVKPNKQTNKQPINTDVAEDVSNKGQEGMGAQGNPQAANVSRGALDKNIVEASLEDNTYHIIVDAAGLFCDLKVQKLGSNEAAWSIQRAPKTSPETKTGSVQQVVDLVKALHGAINNVLAADTRSATLSAEIAKIEEEIQKLNLDKAWQQNLSEEERQAKKEALVTRAEELADQMPDDLKSLEDAKVDIGNFIKWIGSAVGQGASTLAPPQDSVQREIRRVIKPRETTPFQKEKERLDEAKSRETSKYLEDVPEPGKENKPNAPGATTTQKPTLLPKIVMAPIGSEDKSRLKDKAILGITGIKAADYRDGYKAAERTYQGYVDTQNKRVAYQRVLNKSRDTIKAFLSLKGQGATFAQAIEAVRGQIDTETAKETPNDEVLADLEKKLSILEEHKRNFPKILAAVQLSESDPELEEKLTSLGERYEEQSKQINNVTDELTQKIKDAELEMQLYQSELDKNALLEHLQKSVSLGMPDQNSEEFKKYFEKLIQSGSQERAQFESSIKKAFNTNNRNQSRLVERLISFIGEDAKKNVAENTSIFRALSKHAGFLTIKPDQLQSIYQEQLEAKEPAVARRKNQVRKDGQEYVRSLVNPTRLYKGYLPVDDLLEAMPTLLFGKSKQALMKEAEARISAELNKKRVAVVAALQKAGKRELIAELTAVNTALASTTDNAEANIAKQSRLTSQIAEVLPPELRAYAGEVGRAQSEVPDPEMISSYFNNVVMPEMIEDKLGADSGSKLLPILQRQALIQGYATEAYDVHLADSINQIYIDHCSRFTGTLARKRSAHQNIINTSLQSSRKIATEALTHLSGVHTEEGLNIAKLYVPRFYELCLEISSKYALRARTSMKPGETVENPLQSLIEKLPAELQSKYKKLPALFPWSARAELALALIAQEMATPLSKSEALARLEVLYANKEDAQRKVEQLFPVDASNQPRPIHSISEIEQGKKALASAVAIPPSLKSDHSAKALAELKKKQQAASETLIEQQEALSNVSALGEASALVFNEIAGGQSFRVIVPEALSAYEVSPRNLRKQIERELDEAGFQANEFQMNALLKSVLVAFNKKRYGEAGESLVEQRMEGEPEKLSFEQALNQQLPSSPEEKEGLKGTRALILEAASGIAAKLGSSGVVTGGRAPIFIFEEMPEGEGEWTSEAFPEPISYSIEKGTFQGSRDQQIVDIATINVLGTPFDIWVGSREKIAEQAQKLYESKTQYIPRYPEEDEVSAGASKREKKAIQLLRRENFFKAQVANEEINGLLAKQLRKKDEAALAFTLKDCGISPEEAKAIWADAIVDQITSPANPLKLEVKPGPKRSRWGKQGGNFMAEENSWKVGKKTSIYDAVREWTDKLINSDSAEEEAAKEKKARELSTRINGLNRLISEVGTYSPQTRISLPPIDALVNPKYYGKKAVNKLNYLYKIMKGEVTNPTISSDQAADRLIKFARDVQKDLMAERITVLDNGRCNTVLDLICPNEHKDREFTSTVSYLVKQPQHSYFQGASQEETDEVMQWSQECLSDPEIDEDKKSIADRFKQNRFVLIGRKPTCPICGFEFQNIDAELSAKRSEKQPTLKTEAVRYLDDVSKEAAKASFQWIQEKLLWLENPSFKAVPRAESPIVFSEIEQLAVAQADATKRQRTKKNPTTQKVEVVGHGVRLPLIQEILTGTDPELDQPCAERIKIPGQLNWQVELAEQLRGWKADLSKAFGFRGELDLSALSAEKQWENLRVTPRKPGSTSETIRDEYKKEIPKKLIERAPIYRQVGDALHVGYDTGAPVLFDPSADTQKIEFFSLYDKYIKGLKRKATPEQLATRKSSEYKEALKQFKAEEQGVLADSSANDYASKLQKLLETPVEKRTPEMIAAVADLVGGEALSGASSLGLGLRKYTELSEAYAAALTQEALDSWGWLKGATVRFKTQAAIVRKPFVFEQEGDEEDNSIISAGNLDEVRQQFKTIPFPSLEEAQELVPAVGEEKDLRNLNVLRSLIQAMLYGKKGYLSATPTSGPAATMRERGRLEKLIRDFSSALKATLPPAAQSTAQAAYAEMQQYAWSTPANLPTSDSLKQMITSLYGEESFANEASTKLLEEFVKAYAEMYSKIDELHAIQIYLISRQAACATPKTQSKDLEKLSTGKPDGRFFYRITDVNVKQIRETKAPPIKIELTAPLTPSFKGGEVLKDGEVVGYEYNQQEIEKALRTILPKLAFDPSTTEGKEALEQYVNVAKAMAQKYFKRAVAVARFSPSTIVLSLKPIVESGDKYDATCVGEESDETYRNIPDEALQPMEFALPLSLVKDGSPLYGGDLDTVAERWIAQYFDFAKTPSVVVKEPKAEASLHEKLKRISRLMLTLK